MTSSKLVTTAILTLKLWFDVITDHDVSIFESQILITWYWGIVLVLHIPTNKSIFEIWLYVYITQSDKNAKLKHRCMGNTAWVMG